MKKPDRDEFLAAYYECKGHISTLAEKYGISRVKAYAWCRQLPEIAEEVSLEARRLRAWKLWKHGRTVTEVSKMLGISRSICAEHIMVHRRWDTDDPNFFDACTRLPSRQAYGTARDGRWRWED